MSPALERDLATVIAIAHKAGEILLEGWDQRPAVDFKTSERDIVTEFDRRSEAFILQALREAFPQVGVVGEEGAAIPGQPGAGTFYVDPLDGTVNFAHGLPLFAVSIGLHRAGQPVLGVVHAPAVSWTFSGAPGFGAFRNGRPIRPSATATLDRGLLVTGFPTAIAARAANTPSFLAFNQAAEGLRRLGSAALDLCFVACGWLDGTWQRKLHPWDTEGGAAILLGAGGTLTGLSGEPYDPLRGEILATNGHLHAEMQAVLQKTNV